MPVEFQDFDRDETIYSYDDNGIFIGSYTKRIPRGVGMPRNSWNVAPPALGQNQAARFNRATETWEIVPDFRGQKRFKPNGEEVEIKDVGEPDPELSETKPPPSRANRVDRLRVAVSSHITDFALSEGFESTLDAVSYADEPAEPNRQSKAIAIRLWRSQCWAVFDAQIVGQLPSAEDLIAALPAAPGV